MSESCCYQADSGRGSLGRRRRDVEERGEGQRGPGCGGRGAEAARGAKEGGAGQQEVDTWPARVAGSGREKNRERGTGGRRRGT
jgi:hypothetical protein